MLKKLKERLVEESKAVHVIKITNNNEWVTYGAIFPPVGQHSASTTAGAIQRLTDYRLICPLAMLLLCSGNNHDYCLLSSRFQRARCSGSVPLRCGVSTAVSTALKLAEP